MAEHIAPFPSEVIRRAEQTLPRIEAEVLRRHSDARLGIVVRQLGQESREVRMGDPHNIFAMGSIESLAYGVMLPSLLKQHFVHLGSRTIGVMATPGLVAHVYDAFDSEEKGTDPETAFVHGVILDDVLDIFIKSGYASKIDDRLTLNNVTLFSERRPADFLYKLLQLEGQRRWYVRHGLPDIAETISQQLTREIKQNQEKMIAEMKPSDAIRMFLGHLNIPALNQTLEWIKRKTQTNPADLAQDQIMSLITTNLKRKQDDVSWTTAGSSRSQARPGNCATLHEALTVIQALVGHGYTNLSPVATQIVLDALSVPGDDIIQLKSRLSGVSNVTQAFGISGFTSDISHDSIPAYFQTFNHADRYGSVTTMAQVELVKLSTDEQFCVGSYIAIPHSGSPDDSSQIKNDVGDFVYNELAGVFQKTS